MLKVQDENDGQTVPTLSDVKTLTVEEFMAKFPNSTLNEGCLEDVACSNCGNREMFRVFVVQIASLCDSGVEEYEGDAEYDDTNSTRCPDCDADGLMGDFTIDGLDAYIRSKQAQN